MFNTLQLRGEKKNFTIKDGKAYTEDNVLVYNIFAYRIPHSVKQEDALAYFSRYGKVVNLRLVAPNKTRSKPPKIGFIYFEDPEAAARVLNEPKHVMKYQKFSVKACDSWRQPFLANTGVSEIEETDIAKPSLSDLNDDCLAVICKKMQLKDQLRFSRTCRRFQEIFKMCSKVEYKIFDLSEIRDCTLWDVHECFTVAGPYIKKISGDLDHQEYYRVLDFMCRNTPNIEAIDLSFLTANININRFLPKMRSLTELKISDMNFDDVDIESLVKLPNLKVLNLSNCSQLQGRFLCQLPNDSLTDLHLKNCSSLSCSYFQRMCRTLTNLKMLDIERCDSLSHVSYQVLSQNLIELEILKISCTRKARYELLANLPKLKSLDVLILQVPDYMLSCLITALAEKRNATLECLKVWGKAVVQANWAEKISSLTALKTLVLPNNEVLTDKCLEKFGNLKDLESIDLRRCRSITTVGVINLLRDCPKLKDVNLVNCPHIDNLFVHRAIQLLKKRPRTDAAESIPIKFIVDYTGITKDILENPEYCESKSLLTLVFQNMYELNFGENYGGADFGFDFDFYDDDYDVDDDDDIDFDLDVEDAFGRNNMWQALNQMDPSDDDLDFDDLQGEEYGNLLQFLVNQGHIFF